MAILLIAVYREHKGLVHFVTSADVGRFHNACDFCHLLITSAKSYDPHLNPHGFRSGLWPFDTVIMFLGPLLLGNLTWKSADGQGSTKVASNCIT